MTKEVLALDPRGASYGMPRSLEFDYRSERTCTPTKPHRPESVRTRAGNSCRTEQALTLRH